MCCIDRLKPQPKADVGHEIIDMYEAIRDFIFTIIASPWLYLLGAAFCWLVTAQVRSRAKTPEDYEAANAFLWAALALFVAAGFMWRLMTLAG